MAAYCECMLGCHPEMTIKYLGADCGTMPYTQCHFSPLKLVGQCLEYGALQQEQSWQSLALTQALPVHMVFCGDVKHWKAYSRGARQCKHSVVAAGPPIVGTAPIDFNGTSQIFFRALSTDQPG